MGTKIILEGMVTEQRGSGWMQGEGVIASCDPYYTVYVTAITIDGVRYTREECMPKTPYSWEPRLPEGVRLPNRCQRFMDAAIYFPDVPGQHTIEIDPATCWQGEPESDAEKALNARQWVTHAFVPDEGTQGRQGFGWRIDQDAETGQWAGVRLGCNGNFDRRIRVGDYDDHQIRPVFLKAGVPAQGWYPRG